MGTRSRIGVMHGDKVKSVYCHWDGYLEHNGEILLKHYDSAKANHLVALGNLSSLHANIGEKHDFDDRRACDVQCTFYGRDRGETGTEWKVAHDFVTFLEQCDDCGAEYYYIMRDGEWYVGTTYSSGSLASQLVPLAEALADQHIENAETVSAE